MTLDEMKAVLVGRTITDVETAAGFGPERVADSWGPRGGQMGGFLLVLDDGSRVWGDPAFWQPEE